MIMEGSVDSLREQPITMRLKLEAKQAKQKRKKQKLNLEEEKFEEAKTQAAHVRNIEEDKFEEAKAQAAHVRNIENRRMELEEKKLQLELQREETRTLHDGQSADKEKERWATVLEFMNEKKED
jgi:hypothetical protein